MSPTTTWSVARSIPLPPPHFRIHPSQTNQAEHPLTKQLKLPSVRSYLPKWCLVLISVFLKRDQTQIQDKITANQNSGLHKFQAFTITINETLWWGEDLWLHPCMCGSEVWKSHLDPKGEIAPAKLDFLTHKKSGIVPSPSLELAHDWPATRAGTLLGWPDPQPMPLDPSHSHKTPWTYHYRWLESTRPGWGQPLAWGGCHKPTMQTSSCQKAPLQQSHKCAELQTFSLWKANWILLPRPLDGRQIIMRLLWIQTYKYCTYWS